MIRYEELSNEIRPIDSILEKWIIGDLQRIGHKAPTRVINLIIKTGDYIKSSLKIESWNDIKLTHYNRKRLNNEYVEYSLTFSHRFGFSIKHNEVIEEFSEGGDK